MINRTMFLLICLIIACMTDGCVTTKKTEQWEPVQPEQKSFVHVVKWSDENLTIISSWYTGSEKNEEKLSDNNPNINPKQLVIGDRIFIPKDLLIKADPMTEEFLDQSITRSKKVEKIEPQPITTPENVEKTEPKSVTKPEKTEKKETKAVTEESKKKKTTTEPVPEEEEELDLFGPK